MRLGAMNDPHSDVFEEIRWIGQNGFDFVDLTIEAPGAAPEKTEWRSVRDAIQDAELGVVCHTAPYLPIDSPSPLVRQAAMDELRRSIDAAQVVGAGLCAIHFLGWPPWLNDGQGYEYYRQLLAILVQHGQQRSVQIAMENGIRNRHQHKYFREIFHRVPGLSLLYDISHGNIQTAASLTREYLFSLADRLGHVHISDNDGQGDQHLPLGAPMQGGIDLLHELRILRSFHYDGTITLEVFGERRWLLASRELLQEAWELAA